MDGTRAYRAEMLTHTWNALLAFSAAYVEVVGDVPASFAAGDDSSRVEPSAVRRVRAFPTAPGA